jgi:hypothetical protein
VKTVSSQILAFSILIGLLAGSQALAQQSNLDKRYTRTTTTSKPMYVSQQQLAAAQSGANPTSPQPTQNSTTVSGAVPQSQQSDSVPGTIFPGVMPSDQNPDAVAGAMTGVDNGLWEGCDPGNCCAVCGGGYSTPACWYTDQGARIITRSRSRKSPITYQAFSNLGTSSNQTAFVLEQTTQSLNYNIAPGYAATIGRYLGRDSMDRDDFLEFSYWGLNTWTESHFYDSGLRDQYSVSSGTSGFTFTGGNLVTPFLFDNDGKLQQLSDSNGVMWGVGGFDHVDTQTIRVNSEMHNFELNLRLRPRGRPDQLVLNPNGLWKRECQPGTFMSYLVGLRYMTVGDGFNLHSAGTVSVTNNSTSTLVVDHQAVTGDYNIRTENDLLGFQIGSDLMFRRCKWEWGVRTKMGPYVNFSRNVKEITNNLGDTPTQFSFNNVMEQRRQKAALIGEVGFEASYKFRPNLTGRAAYDFMWISGLALAPEQLTWNLDPIANKTINTNGLIFSQGITLGLEWSW